MPPERPPGLALGASLVNWLTFEVAPGALSPDMQCAFFLAWSLLLVLAGARGVRRPGASRTQRARAPVISPQHV
ncbi:MAG: hypothetical protein M3376_10385 [Actinomycetota bacterium]|nr:hypothetical protein [Actinomycetota bacterium]